MNENEMNQAPISLENLLPDSETVECEELLAKAVNFYDLGKISKTVNLLIGIIKRNPNFGKAYSLLGKIYDKKYRDFEQADKYYRAAIQLSPNYRLGYLNYIYFLRYRSRFSEARQFLDKWATLGVDADSIAYEYAFLFEMQGNIKEAIVYYRKAALLATTNATFNEYSEEMERCQRKLEMMDSVEE